MAFPGTVKVKTLNEMNPAYKQLGDSYKKMHDFYTGGETLLQTVDSYLAKRQKEPLEIYQERKRRASYLNYLAGIIDFYSTTLFKTNPVISFTDGSGKPIALAPPEKLQEVKQNGVPSSVAEFMPLFIKDATDGGELQPLERFMQDRLSKAILYGRSFALVDVPPTTPEEAASINSRADQKALGKLRYFLTPFEVRDLINWQRDRKGGFVWVLLKSTRTEQEDFNEKPLAVTEWYYFNRKQFAVYRYTREATATDTVIEDESKEAQLVAAGDHALSSQNIVPLLELSVPAGYWMGNKLLSVAHQHFNQYNALQWSLYMGAFAMPVIFTDREFDQTMGEAYYLKLGKDDKAEWLEQQGKTLDILRNDVIALKDEMFRVAYLTRQSLTNQAEHIATSAASKQRDDKTTHDVLREYGDILRRFMEKVLQVIVDELDDDKAQVMITGFDRFDINDALEEVEEAQLYLDTVTLSPTFEKEAQKKLAIRHLQDASPELKAKIISEIDSADTTRLNGVNAALNAAMGTNAPGQPNEKAITRVPAERGGGGDV